MKHLSRILLLFVFLLSYSFMNAQNEDNPWAVSFGKSAVDFFPVGEDAPQGGMFDEFFNEKDHWNIRKASPKVSVARYLGSGFSVKIDGSFAKIYRIGDMELTDNKTYYSLNAMADYSFGHLIFKEPAGWFDPFIGLGAGATWLDHNAAITGNAELGINFWLTRQIALSLGSTYRRAFSDDDANYSHFQHFAALKIAFGGKDTDGDKIYDKNDECPTVAGLPEFNGCPDTDGDGIPDKNDDCPSVAGLPEFNGCADTDGDGIADPQDACPTEAGSKELNGCPDSDGDGIADKDDKCADEAGPKANDGCPWPDSDSDGVVDKDDQCPDVAGTEANNGCPEISTAKIAELNKYSKTILFDLGKSTIRPSSHSSLEAIANVMKQYPNAKFHLAGFTDSTGSAAINTKLSNARANSVRTYLVEKLGIDGSRLTAQGYGPQNPIASNKTKAGRQQNRRVFPRLTKLDPPLNLPTIPGAHPSPFHNP